LAHDLPPLEDTLPSLKGADLLPERWPRSSAARQFAKGAGFALGGLAISSLGNTNLAASDGRRLGTGIAIAGVTVGALGALQRIRHPFNQAAIAENRRRQEALAARNAAISGRNAARMALLRIIVIPSGAPE
jgi:hypothetical protein